MADIVGNLQVYRKKLLGSGQFGKIVSGIYRNKTEVAVACVDKEEFHVDVRVLKKAKKHSNILEYIYTEETEQFQFVASELIAGTLLDHVTGDYKGPIIGTNRLILKQITKGLAFLHEKEIWHRELKPSNVFISFADGSLRPTMKLGNFGIYRKAGQKCLLEMPINKSWLPPEAYGKFTFTAAMDLFALGCLYGFTLSRGRHPYGDDEENRVSRIKKKEPMTLTVQHLKNVESADTVFQLICSLLNVDPLERPSAKRVLKNAFFSKTSNTANGASLEQAENSVESSTSPECEPETSKQESRKRKKKDKKERTSEKRNKKERVEKEKMKKSKHKDREATVGNQIVPQQIKGSSRDYIRDGEPFVLPSSIPPPPQQSVSLLPPENGNDYEEIRTVTFHSGGTSSQLALPALFDRQNYISLKEEELLKLSSQKSLDAIEMLRFRQLVADRSVCVDCKTHYQETPLLLLCTRNQSDSLLPALQALLIRDDIDLEATYSSYNALNLLIRFYNHHPNLIRCVSLLIRRGIFASQTDKDGQNPLLLLSHLYSGEDLVDVCRLLVRKMSDPATILRSAFILADRGFHQESKILEKMTQSQQPNKKEIELISLCSNTNVSKSDVKLIRKLALDVELDINQRGTCGRSAIQLIFHWNRSRFFIDCLQALLERKSLVSQEDANATEGDGMNRLMIALFKHRDVDTLLKIVTLLIAHGTDPHATANDGRNALHILCCRPTKNGVVPNFYEIAQVLLEAGFDADTRAYDGSNCLIALATNHHQRPDFFAILRLLIQNGADVNAISFKKQNILSILCYKYEGDDFVEIVRLLLESHVNTDHHDKYHNSPLNILIKSRGFSEDSEIVRLIRDSNKFNIYAPRIC